MKYFSKLLSMFLVGMVLVSVGCTDYDEQIRDLHNKIDQNQTDMTEKVDAEINALEADLAQVKADLEAALEAMKNELSTKHKEDVDALKAVDAELDGKIAAANDAIATLEGELAKEVSRLEGEIDTLEAALEAAKKELADAIKAGDDAVKAELTQKITDLETSLLAKINDLQTKLEGDIEDLREDMQKKIDAANDAIAEANKAIDALELRAGALEEQDVLFAEQLKELEENLNTLSDRVTSNYNELKADLAALETKLQAQIDTNKRAIEENALDIVALQAQAEGIIKDVETVRNNVANVEKALVAHIEEFLAYQAAIAGKIAYIESHISALEEQVAAIEALLPEMKTQIEENKKLAQENAADIAKNEALFEAYKQTVANTFDQLKKADATMAATLAILTDDVTELDGELAALVSEFETYKDNVDSQLSDCFAGLDNLEADLDAVNKSLSSQIAANKVQIDALKAQVEAIWAITIQYQNKLNEEIAKREAEDAKILNLLNEKCDELDAEYDARCNKLTEDLETLTGAFNEYKESMVKVIEQLTLTLRKEIAESEARANKYTDIEVGELKDYTDKKLDEVNLEIKGLKEQILDLQKGLMTMYNQLNTTMYELYVQALNIIDERVAALQAQIDELVNRIQSIVPVPEYGAQDNYIYALCDYGATLDYYGYPTLDDDTLLSNGGIFRITYRITPAEAASQIVEYCKKDLSILSFTVEDLTRHEVKDGAKIFDVKLDETGTGRIVVTGFMPTSDLLKERFASTDSNVVAVALVFNNESTVEQEHKGNIVSNFTNLFAKPVYLDKKPIVLEYTKLSDKVIYDMQYTSNQSYYNVDVEGYGKRNEIKYDDLEKKVTVFEGWEPRLAYDKELDGTVDAYYTVEEFAQEVFGLKTNNQFLPEFVINCGHTYYDNAYLAINYDNSNFVCTEDKEGYNDQFAVKEVKKESVGNIADTSLAVSYADTYSAAFGEEVQIIKAYSVVDLGSIQYVWNYADFKEAKDATTPYRDYVRNFQYQVEDISIPAADLVKINEVATLLPLPEDYYTDAGKTELAAALYDVEAKAYKADGTLEPTVLTGWAFTAPTWSKNADSYSWTFNLNGWDFGKKYQVTAKAVLPTLDIIFKFDLDMVALNDAAVTKSEKEFEFKSSIAHYKESFGSSFALLWDQNEEALKHHFTKDQFVGTSSTKSVFVDDSTIEGGLKYYTLSKNGSAASTPTSYTTVPTGTSFLATDSSVIRELLLDIGWSQVTGIADYFDYSTYYTAVFDVDKIKLTNNVHALVKMPEYYVKHSTTYVTDQKSVEGAKYTTEVKGLWSPKFSSDVVDGFSTKHVLLPDAFNVFKLEDGVEKSVDPAVDKIDFVFDITGSVEDKFLWTNYSGIEFNAWSEADEASNPDQMNGIALNTADVVVDGKTYGADKVLTYDGKAAYVFVNGTLRVKRYGAGYIEVPAAFNEYNDNYRVVKYDPIAGWHNEPAVLETDDMSADYVYSLFKSVSLVDARTNNVEDKGWELIDHNAASVTDPWVVGNGYDNGFQTSVNAGKVFGMDVTPYGVTFDPNFTTFVSGKSYEDLNLKNNIKLDTSKGTLRFIGVNSMTIYETVDVVVTVTVDYPWGRKVGDIVVTIPANA